MQTSVFVSSASLNLQQMRRYCKITLPVNKRRLQTQELYLFPKLNITSLYMCIKMFSFLPVLKGQPSRLSQWVFTDLVTYFVVCVDKWIKIQGLW